MVSLLTGAVGGLVATVAMTALMMTLGDDSPPPTALFWSKYVGDEGPEAYMAPGMALHAAYGIGAGIVYVPLFAAVAAAVGGRSLALTATVGAVVWGVVWAVVLFLVAATFWMNVVLDVDADRSAVMDFAVVHLVFGLVLGLWVGLVGVPA